MSASWGKSVEPHVVILCHVERGGRVLGCRQRAPHAVPCLKDRRGEAVRVALVVAGDARAVGWICRRAAPFSPAALCSPKDSLSAQARRQPEVGKKRARRSQAWVLTKSTGSFLAVAFPTNVATSSRHIVAGPPTRREGCTALRAAAAVE